MMIWWWNFYQCLWFLGLSWWSKLDLMSRLSILDSENVPHETGVCYNTVFFLWPRNQFHLLYHSIDNMSVAFTRFLTNQNARKNCTRRRSKDLGNNAWIHKSRLTPISTSKNDWFGQKLSKSRVFLIIWSQSYCHRAIISIFGYFCLLVYLEPFLWML